MQGALVTGHVRCLELYVEGVVEGDVETRSLIIGENATLKGNGGDREATGGRGDIRNEMVTSGKKIK